MPKTFYVTTPIYYSNGPPHLGSVYTTLVADVFARWHRLGGEKVFFLTGTDEHGQKIQETAEKAGKQPQVFVNEIAEKFKRVFKLFNLSNDYFIRTTDKHHELEVKGVLQTLYDAGLIYKGAYEAYYCVGCEQYLTETDLVNGLCPAHKKAPELKKEESYMLRLSSFQKRISDDIRSGKLEIGPDGVRKEMLSFIDAGLRDISISRRKEKVYWGIPLPFDKNHTCYVWVDAFWNYISGVCGKKKLDMFWPADVQLMARDIIRVHSTIWPVLLLGMGKELPKRLFAHGYFTVNGHKMGKSLGNAIDPGYLASKYGVDAIRLYFAKEIPAGKDGDFSEAALVKNANADLGNALGNLLQRTLTLSHKYFGERIPKPGRFHKIDLEIIKKSDMFDMLNEHMQKFEWHLTAQKIWEFVRECNKYVDETKPWTLAEDKERLATVLYTLIESLRIISLFVSPFVPETAEKISTQLGQKIVSFKRVKFRRTTSGILQTPTPIFKKSELENTADVAKDVTPKKDDPFNKLNLVVAVVKDVQDHPNAEKLYVLKLDCGEERQIVAGLKLHIPSDVLKGKHIVIVKNLQTAKLRGVESRGMMLAADKDGRVVPLEAPHSAPGESVLVDGATAGKAQISFDEFLKVNIVIKNKTATYSGKPLRTKTETVSCAISDGASVR